MAIKIKIARVEGRTIYCPTPYCDWCGEEILGPDEEDAGGFMWNQGEPEDETVGASFDLVLVHKNHARRRDHCMDRWEAAQIGKTHELPWNELEYLPVQMFNNPGFVGAEARKNYRFEDGALFHKMGL